MEAKIEATERLRREGRWAEAATFKEERRRELRAEGRPKSEANDQAWAAMVEKFSPLDEEVEALDDAGFEGLMPRGEEGEPDLVRDIIWAYENLENRAVAASDSPSAGAFSLLKFARRDGGKFFSLLLPKALAIQDKRGDYAPAKVEDPMIGEINVMLDDLFEGFRQQLLDDTPATVQQEARDLVGRWRELHGGEVSPEASERLAESIMDLVNRCMEAVSGELLKTAG